MEQRNFWLAGLQERERTSRGAQRIGRRKKKRNVLSLSLSHALRFFFFSLARARPPLKMKKGKKGNKKLSFDCDLSDLDGCSRSKRLCVSSCKGHGTSRWRLRKRRRRKRKKVERRGRRRSRAPQFFSFFFVPPKKPLSSEPFSLPTLPPRPTTRPGCTTSPPPCGRSAPGSASATTARGTRSRPRARRCPSAAS